MKILLAAMPAFLGLLPSVGGARFSAPIVKELSSSIKLQREKKAVESAAEIRHERNGLILALMPVAAVFMVVVFDGLNASTATGLIVGIWVIVLAMVGRGVKVKKIFLGAFDWKMTLNICCILYFIQLLSVTEVLDEIVAAFQASPLPVPVIIACVSLIIDILTGMSQGHVAIVMPIVAAMGTGDLNLAGVAMAFGVAGQMLTHFCADGL